MKNLNLSRKEGGKKKQEETFNACSTLTCRRRFSFFQKTIHIYVQEPNDRFENPTIAEPLMMWKINKLI